MCLCQVVSQCYEDRDPASVVEKLIGRLRDGGISEGSFLQLLCSVQKKALLAFPEPLQSLLDNPDENTPQAAGRGKNTGPVRCSLLFTHHQTFLRVF